MKDNDNKDGLSKQEFDDGLKKLMKVPPPDKDKRHMKQGGPFDIKIRFVPKESGELLNNKTPIGQIKAYEIVQNASKGIGMGKKLLIDGVSYTIVNFELSQFQGSAANDIYEGLLDIYVQKDEDQNNP